MDISEARMIGAESNVGHWQVDGQAFFSKTSALREASRAGSSVRYWYFDDVFRRAKKSSCTLDELYDARARQIRDAYKYVAIAASGGADSTYLIQAFLRQGLIIDEVIGYYPVKILERLESDFDGSTAPQNMAFEYFEAFKPLMSTLHRLTPNTKITVVDHSELAFSTVLNGHLNDSFHDVSRTPNFIGAIEMIKRLNEGEHQDACLVVGSDKPVMLYDAGARTFVSVIDDFTNALLLANLSSQVKIVPFYFSHDAPEIFRAQHSAVKQAVNMYLAAGNALSSLVSERSTGPRPLLDMKNPFLEKVIYPNLWPIRFQAKKPKFTLMNESGGWLFNDRLSVGAVKSLTDFWDGQIKELVHGIDAKFIEQHQGRPAKFNPCLSSWFMYAE